jgi:hypothetical protein
MDGRNPATSRHNEGTATMSWIGVESADDEREARRRAARKDGRRDWMLRVDLDGRMIEARLLRITESEAHSYARRVAGDYTLRPVT